MSPDRKSLSVLAATVFAYFVAFPEDLSPIREILSLTDAVSPWLYGTVMASILAWTIVRCFGRLHS